MWPATAKSLVAAAALVAVLNAQGVSAFFRMGCSNPVVVERADPIVSPGSVSGHLHQILGGNAFNFNQSYADTRTASCSTCQAKADLSNYWTPNLFYHAQNGSFQSVNQMGGGTVYYLQRYDTPGQKLTAFPEGFRMLAGTPGLRSFNASALEQQAISFVCLDYAGSGAGEQVNNFPAHNCPNGLRAQVFFPSCWDGVNVDSTDHKSHMAYPSGMDSGTCPSSHPVRLISIFYEITFDTNPYKDQWYGSGQPFVLSNGDSTGYGFHGDFLNGWDVPSLQIAIDGCTQESGVIDDCSNILPLRTNQEMNDCVIAPRVPEVTAGWMAALPGCNPITNGPAEAAPVVGCTATKAIIAAAQASYLKPVAGWTAVGCGDDSGARLLPNRWAPGGMTVEMCLAHCSSTGFSYAGLEWAQECWCGNSLNTTAIGNFACDTPCQGDGSEFCGGSLRLAVYKRGAAPASSAPASTTSTSTIAPSSTSKPGTTTSKSTSTSAPASKPAVTTKATSSTPKATATTPATKPVPKPVNPPVWQSIGCYYDPVTPRALRGTVRWTGVPMTPKVCQAHCQAAGFIYAGVEWSKECFCGNELHGSHATPANQCNMPCAGDKSQMCGAGYRMSLYQHKPLAKSKRSAHARKRARVAANVL